MFFLLKFHGRFLLLSHGLLKVVTAYLKQAVTVLEKIFVYYLLNIGIREEYISLISSLYQLLNKRLHLFFRKSGIHPFYFTSLNSYEND